MQNTPANDLVFAFNNRSHDVSFAEYVKASGEISISKIPPGEYWLTFARGSDWSEALQDFRNGGGYWELDHSIRFSEREEEGVLHYEKHTLVLHKVINGNLRENKSTKEAFHAALGTHHVAASSGGMHSSAFRKLK